MSNNQITQTISPFIDSQVPEFLRTGSPQFVAFLKAYYEWMEQGNNAVITDSFQLLSYKDIDTTTDQFIQFFINDFLPFFPNDIALDERKLIKVARDFYKKKGSVESIQFLFRVLYNKEADIFFPSDNILRASAGKWILPQALTLVVTNQDQNFDITQLIGRQGVGSISNTTCVIESATFTVEAGLGIEVLEIFVSNIVGAFTDTENLNITYGFDANGVPLVFSEKIIASLSSIQIDPNNRGLKYVGTSNTYSGDPVVISGGLLSGDPSATKAVAFVGNVTSGSITGIIVNNGGFNYRVQPNTEVNVINAPGDTTGTGANVTVSAIDTGNSVFVFINTDSIVLKANQQISSANYGFANIANANQNTTLGHAFSYANLQFAPIVSMNVVNGGHGYTQPPTLQTEVTYYTDYTNQLVLIPDPTDAANSVQFVDDLGFVANVVVVNGGSGYSPTTDVIVVPSSIGYGANFSFTVDGTGAINGVTVNNSGQGYFYLPYNLAVANSANTQNAAAGTGASLVAYGFGQGAQLGLTVNKIGQILDIRLASRGFDYISTPTVSLRVEDLKIKDPGHNLNFATDSIAFQGANANVASYLANIDSYNVSTQTLRLYNYQGSFNAAQNLVTTTANVVANTNSANYLTVYGDGKAKANAIFLNGLINFPGYFRDTSGFLSSDQKLQGANVYHAYSYIVQVEQALNDYKKTLMDLVHPTGTSMIGRFIVQQTGSRSLNATAQVSVDPVVAGNVSSNAFAAFSNNSLVVPSPNDYNNTSYWGLSSMLVTTNSGVLAPDNTNIADRVGENSTTNIHAIESTGIVIVPNTNYTLATYFKPNNNVQFVYLVWDNNAANGVVGTYDILSGNSNTSIRGHGVVKSATTTAVGNGWYLCTLTGIVSPSDTNGRVSIGYAINNASVAFPSYAGNLTNTAFVWGTSVVKGNTTQPFFGIPYGFVVGNGTQFTANANVGDKIVFNTTDSTRKLQVKEITAIANDGNLTMDSNTSFVFEFPVTINTSSNVVTSNLLLGNVAVNDIIRTNVAGNAQTSIVQTTNANTITVNTVFHINASNVLLLVYPSQNAATYSIIKKPT